MLDTDRIDETDLLALVDGHLDPARRRQVEAWLAHHPDDARRVAADLAINDGLHRLFEDIHQAEVPPAITGLLHRPPPPLAEGWRRAAAVLLLLGGGAVAGWSLAPGPMPPRLGALDQYAEVVSDPDAEILAVLGQDLRRLARVPDLSPLGLHLVGQSAVAAQDRRAVRLTYEDGDGHRYALFIQLREAGEPRFFRGEDGGLVYWSEGPLVFALAGEGEDLPTLARVVQAAPAKAAIRPVGGKVAE